MNFIGHKKHEAPADMLGSLGGYSRAGDALAANTGFLCFSWQLSGFGAPRSAIRIPQFPL